MSYEGNWQQTGIPCPCGEGSDNSAIDYNNWLHCFKCGKNFCLDKKGVGESGYKQEADKHQQQKQKQQPYKEIDMIPDATDYRELSPRGLDLSSSKHFKVSCAVRHNRNCLIFPFFDEYGTLVAQKLKYAKKEEGKPDYEMLGDTKYLTNSLFGQHLCKQGGKKIVITEGEIDAMSVSQIGNHKFPTVSLPSGVTSAKKCLAENKKWLQDNFEEIILMFDMDEPGQDGVKAVIPLFDNPKQVKVASLPLKDANEMLVAGKSKELNNAIFNATPYRPKGIVGINDIRHLIGKKPEMGHSYPWDGLTAITHGLGRPEMNVWCAGTGMGKTAFFKAIAAHVMRESNAKVGLILLEETPEKTAVGVAGSYVGQRFDSPLIEYPEEELQEALDSISDNVVLNKLDGINDWTDVKSKIRHMIVAEGCKYIFLDHLTKFADNADSGAENSILQTICSNISDLAMELNANINAISHLRKTGTGSKSFEEGGHITLDDLKGSGALKQYPWNVFSIERDKNETGESSKHVNKITLMKCRNAGENEGDSIYVKYDVETGALVELENYSAELGEESAANEF